MKAEDRHCLETYKKYLENNESKYAYVNEFKYPSTEKAVIVSLFCVDFGTSKNTGKWTDIDYNCDIYFWIPRKFSWYNCSNCSNSKIPKWLAIKNIEKCLEQDTTNLVYKK